MPRRLALLAGIVLFLAALVGTPRGVFGVEVGKNLPGTFQPFNVNVSLPVSEEPEEPADNKGPKLPKYSPKGKYHCLVTEYDLDPVVMLVVRNLDDNAAFRDLVGKLDAALDKNRAIRLRCFVVFVPADIKNTAEDVNAALKDDDRRDKLVKEFEKFVADVKLNRVVVSIASEKDLTKYKLDSATALTAILYKKLRVEAVHKLGADKFDAVNSPAVKALMADVGAKLGAK